MGVAAPAALGIQRRSSGQLPSIVRKVSGVGSGNMDRLGEEHGHEARAVVVHLVRGAVRAGCAPAGGADGPERGRHVRDGCGGVWGWPLVWACCGRRP